jgi:hypothetical protein
MTYRTILGLASTLVAAAGFSFAFGQGAPAGQAPAQGGQQGQQGQRGGFTFSTNGNGGLVEPPEQQQGQQGQRGGRGQRANAPAPPAPRRADGRVAFTPPPGQPELWVGGITNFTSKDGTPLKVPYQPWTQGVSQDRRQNQLEPHTRCKPSGGPRQFLTPYGVEFVELPDLQRILIMDVGGPHTFRIIHMDGRPHPKNLQPDYYGHNVGRWEGDTLVVDSTGYNEKFWFDRGTFPHTEKLHLIERFTRTDMNTMRYEITVDDPLAYTEPWTGVFNLRRMPGEELFEYVCQENNFASELMVGVMSDVDQTSPIVP